MDSLEILDVEQGTPEWHAARCGVVTASEFRRAVATRLAREKSARQTYMRTLAGEILLGKPAESPDIENFRRGHALEPEACELYRFATGYEPDVVGFMRRGRIGASPDRLVGDDGGVEIKSALPHIQIGRLLDDVVPPEYEDQVRGCLLVSGRAWWDFMSYCPGLPPLIKRVDRNERAMAELRVDLDQFISELDDLVERLRSL